jgi:hypothetical protein
VGAGMGVDADVDSVEANKKRTTRGDEQDVENTDAAQAQGTVAWEIGLQQR